MNYPLRLEDILNHNGKIEPSARISESSRFSDDIWDFHSSSVARVSSVTPAKLRIDWASYSTGSGMKSFDDHRGALITPRMIEQLKQFTYFYFQLPSAFGLRGVNSVKPNTLVTTARALILLFSDVLKLDPLRFTTSIIQDLSDIRVSDLRQALLNSPRSDGSVLKKGLKLLASPLLSKIYADRALQWNAQDIETLEFKFPSKRSGYNCVMPNELFRLLSNSACADIFSFLCVVGEEPFDKTATKKAAPAALLELEAAEASSLISDYFAIREADRTHFSETGKKQPVSGVLRKRFITQHGVTPQSIFDWLYRVQRASFTIIGLYTGARYSDLSTFTKDCLQTWHGAHVLAGTSVKHKALDAEENVDLWPATPIMRDAVKCLAYISKATFNPYLISSSESVPIGRNPKALSLSGFTGAINSYLHEIDVSKRWQNWKINPHQLRHTLAHQLARADVGLIYIAHQMKHLHSALSALPPEVTMMYGNVGDLATQRALHSESAFAEVANELYSPDRPIAGGGAEEFMSRRKAYFEGMAAQGWSTEEVLGILAKQGLPFASVGLGYCGGRRDTLLKDGTRDTPPCIGSLQCNPGVCKQAVITSVHAATWKKIAEQNKLLLADPRMAHATASLESAVETAEQVLSKLGHA